MSPDLASLLTGIALVAVLVARRGIAVAATRSASADQLARLYTLLAILLALRLLSQILAAPIVAAALMLVAAWLPMTGLRFVEELQRRHAPRPVKIMALGGAIAFSVLALTIGFIWSREALLALATYQTLMIATMVVLLATSRRDLAPAERRTADTFLVALLLAIPLVAADFDVVMPSVPVRGGPFAVLILVLATSRHATGDGAPRYLLADVAIAIGGGGLASLIALAVEPALTRDRGIAIAAGGAAIAALLLLVERLGAARAQDRGLVAALARAGGEDRAAIIGSHPTLASGRMLGPQDLVGYPAASLAHLIGHRVIGVETGDSEARDAARDLLDATAATHLVRLSRDPPSFLAITASGLASSALDDELAIAARLIEKAP